MIRSNTSSALFADFVVMRAAHPQPFRFLAAEKYPDEPYSAEELRQAYRPHLLTMSPERRTEFLAGRRCAHAALLAASTTPTASTMPPASTMPTATSTGPTNTDPHALIGRGEHRQPLWPGGWVGSITHTSNYVAAAVAPRAMVQALGLDSQSWLSPEAALEVRALVALDREIALVENTVAASMVRSRTEERGDRAPGGETELGTESAAGAITALFSLKESLFKCLFPVAGVWFDFLNVEVVACASGRCILRLCRELNERLPRGQTFEASWALSQAHVHTGVLVAAALP